MTNDECYGEYEEEYLFFIGSKEVRIWYESGYWRWIQDEIGGFPHFVRLSFYPIMVMDSLEDK